MDEFLARGRRLFKQQTENKPKEEVEKLRAELLAWREEYRAECAKDDVDAGDRYKVMKKLIVQLESIVRIPVHHTRDVLNLPQTRRFWTHYGIAVIGWLVSVDSTDLPSQAAGGVYANNEFAHTFLTENEVAIREMLADLQAIVKYVAVQHARRALIQNTGTGSAPRSDWRAGAKPSRRDCYAT